MTVTKATADAIDARVEHATNGLNITCIKGYPAWDGSPVTLPIAALLFESDTPITDRRVSKSRDGYVLSFTLWVFCDNELDLFAKVDLLRSMLDNWSSATIDSKAARITGGIIEREVFPDELATEETRYSVRTTLQVQFNS